MLPRRECVAISRDVTYARGRSAPRRLYQQRIADSIAHRIAGNLGFGVRGVGEASNRATIDANSGMISNHLPFPNVI